MANPDANYTDLLIVGAGLAGIDTAYRVSSTLPELSYTVLERRDGMGGTWDLFKYPGIRSDSDIFTLSYPFLPWDGSKTLASGPEIKAYIEKAAATFGIDKHIRFGTKVLSADFDTSIDLWTVRAERNGEEVVHTARFVVGCTGYYNYDKGYEPKFPGIEDFKGQVVYPQFWPEDLDYQGKKVVVIGSGATAITLVPAMADDVERITMLQRSPTYVSSLPSEYPLTKTMQRLLPAGVAHNAIRYRNSVVLIGSYLLCRQFPTISRQVLRAAAKAQLPKGYEVDVHFKPKYAPWDQRLCAVPDGDLFKTLKSGKAEVVTDTIDHVSENGIVLSSGRELEADIIISATGLSLLAFGGIDLSIDGEPTAPHDHFAYRGHMLSDVPNFAFIIGYTNASWTLRADISARAIARLLAYMKEHGYTHAAPHTGGGELEELPAFDLAAGYVQRSPTAMPKAATIAPWRIRNNYWLDALEYRRSDVEDSIEFGTVAAPAQEQDHAAVG
ncbi:flavin-containing monooxygenase [Tsukamurella soli]|uniref:NAD(P)/FAD-dependent oxidoreductase n=1 Tax=Tsukamurella soli TaxID=644556 RepID=A0ABP8J499_9ACTN